MSNLYRSVYIIRNIERAVAWVVAWSESQGHVVSLVMQTQWFISKDVRYCRILYRHVSNKASVSNGSRPVSSWWSCCDGVGNSVTMTKSSIQRCNSLSLYALISCIKIHKGIAMIFCLRRLTPHVDTNPMRWSYSIRGVAGFFQWLGAKVEKFPKLLRKPPK